MISTRDMLYHTNMWLSFHNPIATWCDCGQKLWKMRHSLDEYIPFLLASIPKPLCMQESCAKIATLPPLLTIRWSLWWSSYEWRESQWFPEPTSFIRHQVPTRPLLWKTWHLFRKNWKEVGHLKLVQFLLATTVRADSRHHINLGSKDCFGKT